MKDKRIKAAIIGCGKVSKAHVKAINANKGKVELYAVCDENKETAVEALNKYGAQKYFTDYKKLLDDDNIDLVCICAPSGTHVQLAVDCAKAYKHVLCEKPIAITRKGIDKLEEAFGNTNLKFGSVFQYRTFPGLIKAKRMLDNGSLGKILTGDGYCKIYRSEEYYKSADWRGKWEYDGGGCLMNQAIHTLDVLNWLMGDTDYTIAKTTTLAREIEVEDTAYAILIYKNAAYGSFQATTLAYPDKGVNVEIQCENGRISFSDPYTYLHITDNDMGEVKKCLDEVKNDESNTANELSALSNAGHTFLMDDIATSIIEDRQTYIPIIEGRKAVDIILSMYQSSKKNKAIKISEVE